MPRILIFNTLKLLSIYEMLLCILRHFAAEPEVKRLSRIGTFENDPAMIQILVTWYVREKLLTRLGPEGSNRSGYFL